MPILRSPSLHSRPGLRARIASAVVRLGGRIHMALADLGMWIDPRLQLPTVGRVSPWAGLIVILLLVAGIALIGGGAAWALREAVSHREDRS